MHILTWPVIKYLAMSFGKKNEVLFSSLWLILLNKLWTVKAFFSSKVTCDRITLISQLSCVSSRKDVLLTPSSGNLHTSIYTASLSSGKKMLTVSVNGFHLNRLDLEDTVHLLQQGSPTSGIWYLMIWGGADVIIEIKCTINGLKSSWNHPLPCHLPSLWKNYLPWNQSLVPKSLGTSITLII